MQNLWLLRAIVLGGFAVNQGFWLLTMLDYRKALKRQREQYVKLYEFSRYLLHILEENETQIDFTEFDLIALEFLSEKNR